MAHILIVDDNAAFLLAISESLRFRGYTVAVAQDSSGALRQAHETLPDLVLLDIQMPGMDGLSLCQELRSNPRFQNIPVIILSVRSDLADKLAAYEAGADDFLVKPFDMRELVARLEVILRRSARQSAAGGEHTPQLQAEPDPPANDRVLEAPGLRLHLDTALVQLGDRTVRLTPAEFDLLRYLLLHPDQILSSERLLQEVWLYPAGVGDPALVRWHIKNLRRKIERQPEKPTRLRTIGHRGYIFVARPELF